MKASELRIGNYINYFSESADKWYDFHQVTANTIECIDYNDGAVDHGDPIPLTEHLLMKFGFEIDYIITSMSGATLRRIVGDKIANFRLTYSGSDWWLSHIYGHCFGFSPIKYVHQLQNLYFALTGEELREV
jgi:hypothetical protein